MKWLVYNLLFGFAYLLMLPKFLLRMCRRGGYARFFLQRIGLFSDELMTKLKGGGRVWIHAVSVGEMGVALRVMKELRLRQPDMNFVVSTNTSTAFALAERKLSEKDALIYFPLDCPAVVSRVVRQINPRLLLLTECELWPNLIRHLHKKGVPVALYNGRLSNSSFKGYKAAKFFFKDIVQMLDSIIMQGEPDRQRIIELGADSAKVFVEGTVKYDMGGSSDPGAESVRRILHEMGLAEDGLVIVAGSTWAGEEEVLLRTFKELKSDVDGLKLVLVPRHAERREEVSSAISAAGLDFMKKTDIDAGNAVRDADILLVDTTGELLSFYAAADVVFVGKSLTQHGGQNFIEPAMNSKPVIVGPNLENFPVIAKEFLDAGAMVQVADGDELLQVLRELLQDESRRQALGERAGGLVQTKRGAVKRIADRVLNLL